MKDKHYFASDFHLGIWSGEEAKQHEKKIVRWLDLIKTDAKALYLVGDLFDCWFEYNRAVPKGFVRFLGKLAELSDNGTKLYIFSGNHDLWTLDYFKNELNAIVLPNELEISIEGKNFFLHHGDGIGEGGRFYKFCKKYIYKNLFLQFCYRHIVHCDLGLYLAHKFSRHSRNPNDTQRSSEKLEKEQVKIKAFRTTLKNFCATKLSENHCDYFIFGHNHNVYEENLNESSRLIILGDWITSNAGSYAVFDGISMDLKEI